MPTSTVANSHASLASRGSPGRPRKAGPREPNGRLQRQGVAQERAELAHVLAFHPQRRGSESRLRATLIGRLLDPRFPASPGPGYEPAAVVVEDLSAEQAYDLAERYLRAYQRWQAVRLSRRPLAVTGGGGSVRVELDLEDERKEYEGAMRAWADVSRALRDAGERVEQAFDAIVLHAAPEADQRLVPAWIRLSLPAAFRAIEAFYRTERRRPG